jgi:hypothetical protein
MADIRKGQRFRSKAPVEVTCLTSWAAPYTGGDKRTLPADEVIVIANDPPATATAVYCNPERCEELHTEMVPLSDRTHPLYRGYYLAVKVAALRTEFEQL